MLVLAWWIALIGIYAVFGGAAAGTFIVATFAAGLAGSTAERSKPGEVKTRAVVGFVFMLIVAGYLFGANLAPFATGGFPLFGPEVVTPH